MRNYLGFILLFLCIYWQTPAAASTYQDATIHSQYLDHATGTWKNSTDWIFRENSQGRISISQLDETTAMLILDYEATSGAMSITKRFNRGTNYIETKETSYGPIILSNGSPIPYDQLAPNMKLPEQINVRNTVSGVTFSTLVNRTLKPITPADALAAGMIPAELAQSISLNDLTLISIQKSGQLEIHQLWRSGETFWLYEETPSRKSWRLSLSLAP